MQNGTFSAQQFLPSLPIPGLNESIDRYLKSLKNVFDDSKHAVIEKSAKTFVESSDAKLLQNFLLTKAKNERNWLENWWYDAYTMNRETLLTQNMGGIIPKIGVEKESQITVAARLIYHVMSYWNLVRQEKVDITVSGGIKWDMSQVYNLFNASRIADFPKDKISRYFRTESEGDCPSHIIIICNGSIWKFCVTNPDNSLKSVNAIEKALELIKSKSSRVDTRSVVPLTSLGRDEWAKIRHSLIENSAHNTGNFELIDSSVFSLTMVDDFVEDESKLMKYSLFGSAYNCYCDKNLNLIVMRDGKACLQAEHGNVDAISLFAPCDYAADNMNKNPQTTQVVDDFCVVEKLEFQSTADLANLVNYAEKNFKDLAESFNFEIYNFKNFGSKFCKTNGKFYADTIIQIALQLAYFKTHKKLAPTYETASSRKFYHGRTETVRSLTSEIALFFRAIENGATSDAVRTLFFDAYNTHCRFLELARDGKGFDRHFFGLRKAQENLANLGKPTEISFLDDVSFSESGGNGNFKLSTSLLGYVENGTFGCVTPMCKGGYGAFYRINSESFTFTITALANDETDIPTFCQNLESAFLFLQKIIIGSKI
ncbi:unnamed protein product [Caenorhabditis angaria]|uniref:Choline/carnitine acyltransferase domain-containing protein n=1 Tax=Caenorhabditis angaria TaxID=860376 RepID=A0A9P1J0C2_9PELO|nr:unnamed protein product [Caenorhabditis angaria]